MTEFRPLGYAASVVVLFVIVAYAAAVQWSPRFRAVTVKMLWTLAWMGQWTLGKAAGVSVWVSEKTLWAVYCLAELWCPPVAVFLFRGIQRAWRYRGLRTYIGSHAV